ncbi:unnamed protein product [Hymenolepis diminuta]|uniref:Uncharacterized protein n=1 Tax=Hymenolepis diminuta TaxID=6216 RepID=A0A564ZDN2_HYMDI|nr:unnamed protein product [Hymenolepis diminuta]
MRWRKPDSSEQFTGRMIRDQERDEERWAGYVGVAAFYFNKEAYEVHSGLNVAFKVVCWVPTGDQNNYASMKSVATCGISIGDHDKHDFHPQRMVKHFPSKKALKVLYTKESLIQSFDYVQHENWYI